MRQFSTRVAPIPNVRSNRGVPIAAFALTAALAAAPAPPAEQEPHVVGDVLRPASATDEAPRNGVRVYRSDDPAYKKLESAERQRSLPEAISRLVVIHDGALVLDRGLKNESWTVEMAGGAGGSRVEGVVEDAAVSEDGSFAVVLTTTYRRPQKAKTDKAQEPPPPPVGVSELVWIDPLHPDGKWTQVLEDGRFAKQILPLSPAQGVAVSTIRQIDGPADLRILGPDGKSRLRLDEAEGSVLALDAASHGGFLAADLAYPDRQQLPHRGVVVLDLVHGTRWAYQWRYGSDEEAVQWQLDDSGVLEVTTPVRVRRFDRAGKPLSTTKRG
jgi:hypothetical protein